MKQTYSLNWEIIQEFTLPPGHSCCSIDVNEALGEILFACRHNGLLHYKWNPHTGLVLATKQPHRVTNYARNCRLVTCCSDGSYLVLNHRQLRCIRLASHRVYHSQMQQQLDAHTSCTNRTGSVWAAESLTAYSRSAAMDYIEYLDQAVSVGDVRSMVADKQADSVFLLYPDRLVRNSLSNLADSCVFDRCYALTAELFNVRISRQFVYLMNSVGDIMLRYRSECYDKRDQLSWHTIGSRAFLSPDIVDQQATNNRDLCLRSSHYLQLLDSESPVGLLGLASDPCRQILFASTGGPSLYGVWHPDLEPDLSPSGWGVNWLEDIRISLADGRNGRVCRGGSDSVHNGGIDGDAFDDEDSDGRNGDGGHSDRSVGSHSDSATGSIFVGNNDDDDSSAISGVDSGTGSGGVVGNEPPAAFVPGPLACASSSATRSAYLYAVDANSGDRVCVLRYSTDTARIG